MIFFVFMIKLKMFIYFWTFVLFFFIKRRNKNCFFFPCLFSLFFFFLISNKKIFSFYDLIFVHFVLFFWGLFWLNNGILNSTIKKKSQKIYNSKEKFPVLHSSHLLIYRWNLFCVWDDIWVGRGRRRGWWKNGIRNLLWLSQMMRIYQRF